MWRALRRMTRRHDPRHGHDRSGLSSAKHGTNLAEGHHPQRPKAAGRPDCVEQSQAVIQLRRHAHVDEQDEYFPIQAYPNPAHQGKPTTLDELGDEMRVWAGVLCRPYRGRRASISNSSLLWTRCPFIPQRSKPRGMLTPWQSFDQALFLAHPRWKALALVRDSRVLTLPNLTGTALSSGDQDRSAVRGRTG